jgi:hypothetical protein
MMNLKNIGCLAVALMLASPSWAQMLDDESVAEETVEYDVLFNEMYDEKEVEGVKIPTSLDDLASSVSIKVNSEKKEDKEEAPQEELPPLDGEISIGLSKDSFVIFQDIIGRTTCSFGVTVRSSLNRDIKSLALRLVYPESQTTHMPSAFAFIYRDIKAGGVDEKFITTHGDICYNISGVPNIDINRCRIFSSKEDECAKRIKWDAEIESPDLSKSPYL